MAQSRAESTRDKYNYGQYLNQFPPNTIKVLRELNGSRRKYVGIKCLLCLKKFAYIYIYIYIYIVIHRQTLLLYHNSSVWLDTRDASSWDLNLSDLTSVRYIIKELSPSQRKWRDFLRIWLFTYMILSYQSAQIMKRASHLRVCGSRRFPTRCFLSLLKNLDVGIA